MNEQNYPDVTGVQRNPRMARMLFAPRAGELQAISDYTYYSIVFADTMPELSALFEDISLTEMRHFRLLGDLIVALSGDPVVNLRLHTAPLGLTEDNDSRAPVAAVRVVESLLRDEEAASREYARLAAAFQNDPAAAAILTRLSADEAGHARMLRRALSR